MIDDPLNILVLGASYGLLPGVKLAMAGHRVTFVGREEEIAQLSASDLLVRIPHRRGKEMTELRCSSARFATPDTAEPQSADLAILAMQEPQFAAPEAAAMTRKLGEADTPCLSIMNLPPPPFLARLGISGPVLDGVFSSDSAWETLAPAKVTNASPDPQALRMDPAKPGELTVTLASNFKAAPFECAQDQQILERVARDMSRLKVDGSAPPVRMLAHSSAYIPLAKWPMLIAGNCRCVESDGIRTISEAVLSDTQSSKAIYQAVSEMVIALGADPVIMVPFDAYAKAAEQLTRPSSAARAIASGKSQIERIDLLVRNLMQRANLDTRLLDPIVSLTEQRLVANRNQN